MPVRGAVAAHELPVAAVLLVRLRQLFRHRLHAPRFDLVQVTLETALKTPARAEADANRRQQADDQQRQEQTSGDTDFNHRYI